jgi:hypothetical protein
MKKLMNDEMVFLSTKGIPKIKGITKLYMCLRKNVSQPSQLLQTLSACQRFFGQIDFE